MRPGKKKIVMTRKIKWKDLQFYRENKNTLLKKGCEPNYTIGKSGASLFDNCVFTISPNIIALMGCQGKD